MADELRLTIIGSTKCSRTFLAVQQTTKNSEGASIAVRGSLPLLTPENFIAEGDYVVVQLRRESTSVKREPIYNNRLLYGFRFADGKIQEIIGISGRSANDHAVWQLN
jgi:hypothetical protein